MILFPREHETIDGVGRALRGGRTSCVEVLEGCLARVDKWEDRVHAWVVLDRAGARAEAQARDEELAAGLCRGPLHGIPIGVKDIIDVEGLPTAAGFAPWRDQVATRDAGIVAGLRAAGAVILGKTVTTQFAWIDPPPTRNPWDLGRTPGGSSSGSAAAVATGMCLGAIGTQTGGSITRPASFCGVAGLKPTYNGRAEGVVPFAPHLDHPGPIARSVLDLGLLFMEFLRLEPGSDASPTTLDAVSRLISETFSPRPSAPRLGRLRGPYEARVDPVMHEAIDHALAACAAQGAKVVDVNMPFDFEDVLRNHRVIMAAEAAAGHWDWFSEHADDYRPKIRALVEEGRKVAATDYLRARGHQDALRLSLSASDGTLDALVMPATIGPAPDPSTTGDPSMNAPWSYAGSPTVSFPVAISADGLPLAIQLVECRWLREGDLIATARWCEDAIRRAHDARRV